MDRFYQMNVHELRELVCWLAGDQLGKKLAQYEELLESYDIPVEGEWLHNQTRQEAIAELEEVTRGGIHRASQERSPAEAP